MKTIQSKAIGIIGGMGPYASAYFYKLLIDKSKQFYGDYRDNHDYPEIVLDSLPVPDLISNIKKLQFVREQLLERVKKLNHFGVSEIGMVCNTAHILYQDLRAASKSPFISMIEAAAAEAKNRKIKKIGILATPTTIRFDLYGEILNNLGIKYVYAPRTLQHEHEMVIRQVIDGKQAAVDVERLTKTTQQFINQEKLDGLILACTELPLVFPNEKFANVVDCLDCLAESLLLRYYQKENL